VALIDWKSEFSLGIPEIDADHADLVEHINVLHEQQQAGADHTTICYLLVELHVRIKEHFEQEEKLMQKYGYDAFAEHRADHDRLLNELTTFISDVQAIVFDDEAIGEWLKRWYAVHSQTHDARLVQLISAGLRL